MGKKKRNKVPAKTLEEKEAAKRQKEAIKKQEEEKEKQFFISQIDTTKKIIETFSNTQEFSPTMLINSLLSLVILPFEKAKKKDNTKIFPGEYKGLTKRLNFNTEIFQPLKSCKAGEIAFNNKNIYEFVKKFRNGIAHQNLKVSVNENREIYITIFNIFPCQDCIKCTEKKCKEKGLSYRKGGPIDFQLTVTVVQLQKIAIYIADSYLKAIKGET